MEIILSEDVLLEVSRTSRSEIQLALWAYKPLVPGVRARQLISFVALTAREAAELAAAIVPPWGVSSDCKLLQAGANRHQKPQKKRP